MNNVIHLIKRAVIRYLYIVGILFNIGLVLAVVVSVFFSLYVYRSYQLPAYVFFEKAEQSLANNQSPLLNKLALPAGILSKWLSPISDNKRLSVSGHEQIIGAHELHSHVPDYRGKEERLYPHYQQLAASSYSRTVHVNSTKALLKAIKTAQPGDDIVIARGDYFIKQPRIYLTVNGEKYQPIRIRAERFGDVTIGLSSYEGFVMQGNYWSIENLKINGECKKHLSCEHAIHIVGGQNIIVRNNEITNFNSIIKANGSGKSTQRLYPDDILIEQNSFYNTSRRNTHTAVTLIDVVAGDNWLVRKNIIAGNSKNGSDRTSYAAFLKGNSSNGLFERNIVDCDKNLEQDGSTRIGLSFGGGGTGTAYCRDANCAAEHRNGVMRNNLILNCQRDVGVYLNKANNSQLIHNTIINNLGVDVRFSASDVVSRANLTTSAIRERDGGQLISHEDVVIKEINVENIPLTNSEASDDLCGDSRGKFSAVGAMNRQCLGKIRIIKENN
ncbi:chondroitinase-B domain-containing protein [Thalassotalea sp. 1_MG-2023]|uniref:chondroitinase-B domain-containing protein n=1 Tax=Thalassotalea sp. 1_MG-2023 TaxID=3062680 RepID=UPI0026E2F660|nr:chondroitinase-B domain-containing protein [Thalassotalea sp. 1_MG-2023]MDO6425495.1 chondroitinase-B domain-containing protein [Thalassotalea sp. 1_MG-2023]